MTNKVFNVLFLCTGNSARSILAESILTAHGGERFRAYSAGSFPRGEVNPHALSLLSHLEFPTAGLRSKSWDEFAAPGAPDMDIVITVCDAAAQETCPVWPGHPAVAHWGIADPAAVEGSEVDRMSAFRAAFHILEVRIRLLLALPLQSVDRLALQHHLHTIHRD